MNQVAVYESKKSRLERIKGYCQNKYAQWGAAATVTAMTVSSAHAADAGLDITPLTDGFTSVTSNAKLIFGAALIVIGLFVAWRYTKRGASAA